MYKVSEVIEKLNQVLGGHPELEGNRTRLAERAGLNQPTVQRILAGDHKNPSLDNVLKIAKACGAEVSVGEDKKPPLYNDLLLQVISELETVEGFKDVPAPMKAKIIVWTYSKRLEGVQQNPQNVIDMFKFASGQ